MFNVSEKEHEQLQNIDDSNVPSLLYFQRSLIGQAGDRRIILRPLGDKLSHGSPVIEIRSFTDDIYEKIVYKPK